MVRAAVKTASVIALLAVAAFLVLRFGGVEPDATGRADSRSFESNALPYFVLDPRTASTPGQSGHRTSDGFDCEPYDPFAGLSGQERLQAWERESAEIARRLGTSEEAEHLVVAAMLEARKNLQRAFELLVRASAIAPDNPLVTWNLLQICSRAGDVCTGRLDDIEQQAIAADAGNAALWASMASIRQRRGDDELALTALRMAAGAPEYNAYFGEHLLLYDRALAAGSDRSSMYRISAAWGFAPGASGAELQVITDCRESAEISVLWRDYCQQLGETMARRGRTYLHTSVGLSLQSHMYGVAGETQQQQKIDEQHAKLRQEYNRLSEGDIDKILSRDESLLRAYTDVIISSDELAAINFAQREIERLKSMPDYDPCM
jgi:hypothetical protein